MDSQQLHGKLILQEQENHYSKFRKKINTWKIIFTKLDFHIIDANYMQGKFISDNWHSFLQITFLQNYMSVKHSVLALISA